MNGLACSLFLKVCNGKDIHISSEQLDLQGDNGLSDPHDRENTGEDKRRLFVVSPHGKKHAKK